MERSAYTNNEIVLCTYLALYGESFFLITKKIATIGKRSEASVKMKVQNIAAMLDEAGVDRSQDIKALTGVTTGQDGRKTNWDVVSQLLKISKEEHKQMCKEIILSCQK